MGFFNSLFNALFAPPSSSSIRDVPSPIHTYSSSFEDKDGYYNEYPQLFSSATDNNLNYTDYTFSGKFTKTGKMRTKRHIQIFKNEDVLSSIQAIGYEDPIQYTRETPPPPSSAQMDYLRDLAAERGESVPAKLSASDASALISRYVDHDRIPNPELFEYADEMHIGVSYYCGKRMLYDIIFSHLNKLDRSAFFIFCVYRDIEHSISGNLNQVSCKNFFYTFAESVENDAKFQKSLDDNYYGSDLRFFGSKYSKALGYSLSGGSKRTSAYKSAKAFLISHGLIYPS